MSRPDLASERLERAATRRSADDVNFAILLPVLAWAHLELGRVDEAREEIDRALALSEGSGSDSLKMPARRVQGLLLAEQKRWREAHHALDQAAGFYRERTYPYEEARSLEVSGLVWMREGNPEQAQQKLREALSLYHRLGARQDAERAQQALSALTVPR